MATNLFGQGSKRGLIGRFTDRVRRAYNTPGGVIGRAKTPQEIASGLSSARTAGAWNQWTGLYGNASTGNMATGPGGAYPQAQPTGSISQFRLAEGDGEAGSGAGGGPVWEPRMFQGQMYYDEQSYNSAKAAAEDAYYQNQLAGVGLNYGTGSQRYTQGESGLNQEQENVGYDFTNNLNALLANRDEALNSQKGYFSSIAPEAYQSQEGTYATKTQDEFGRGETELNRQKTQAMDAITQALGNLGQSRNVYNTNYQTVLGELESGRGNLLDEEGNPLYDFTNRVGTDIPVFGASYENLNAQPALQGLANQILAPGATNNEQRRAAFKNLNLSPGQLDSLLAYLYPAGA